MICWYFTIICVSKQIILMSCHYYGVVFYGIRMSIWNIFELSWKKEVFVNFAFTGFVQFLNSLSGIEILFLKLLTFLLCTLTIGWRVVTQYLGSVLKRNLHTHYAETGSAILGQTGWIAVQAIFTFTPSSSTILRYFAI